MKNISSLKACRRLIIASLILWIGVVFCINVATAFEYDNPTIPHLNSQPTLTSGSNNNTIGNVNSSSYWGNYFYGDYNMPTILSFAYNQTQPFTNWLSTFVYDYNQTIPAINYVSANAVLNNTLGGYNISAKEIKMETSILNSTEWRFLDGQNQQCNTTSSPQFVNLGLGVTSSATRNINILMDANDIYGIYIDGTTTPYTATTAPILLNLQRTVNTATSTQSLSTQIGYLKLTNNHKITGSQFGSSVSNIGLKNELTVTGEHDFTDDDIPDETNVGTQGNIVRSGTITATGFFYGINNIGEDFTVNDRVTYNNADGSLLKRNFAKKFVVNSALSAVTAGTVTTEDYGLYSQVTGNTAGTSVGYGVWVQTTGHDTDWAFYNDPIGSVGNNYMGADNIKTYFGTGSDAYITFDGTNLIFNTNSSTAQGLAWFSNNVSAQNLIDRSWYWDDKLGSSLDYVKDSKDLTTNGQPDDTKLSSFEQANYQVVDYSKPEEVEVQVEICGDAIDSKTNKTVKQCNDITELRTIYPYTKNETGRLVSATIGKHEQNIFDLNELVKNQTILINNLNSEITKIKECTNNSIDWKAYQICIEGTA